MTQITDEYMREQLSRSRTYCFVLLRATPKRKEPGADKLVWEHGRRNFGLRQEGLLAIVCPATGEGDVRAVAIFNADVVTTKKIMDDDPAVAAGIFTYETYECRGFPGDKLP
jgi:hypothetical protein